MRTLTSIEVFSINGGLALPKKPITEPAPKSPSLGPANGSGACLGGGFGGSAPSGWSVVRPPSNEFV